MKCKNCGATVPNGTSICSNCGAVANKSSNYVSLSNDVDYSSKNKNLSAKNKSKSKNFWQIILCLILVMAVGAGSYYYFYSQNKQEPQPFLDFYAGYGVINGDEQVVYVSIKDSSKIQFINGVACYDKNMYSLEKDANQVSTEYNYTKNVDNSFRSIFFDIADLNVEEGKNYSYTFEIKIGFYNDENIYTYYQPVNFVGSTQADVSEIVFDHTKQDTNKVNEITTTQQTEVTNDYLFKSYWYSNPVVSDKGYSIYTLYFNEDETVTKTSYSMETGQPWSTNTVYGTYMIKNDIVTVKIDNSKTAQKFQLDKENQALYDYDTKSKSPTTQYTARKYNNIKQAKNQFGL